MLIRTIQKEIAVQLRVDRMHPDKMMDGNILLFMVDDIVSTGKAEVWMLLVGSYQNDTAPLPI